MSFANVTCPLVLSFDRSLKPSVTNRCTNLFLYLLFLSFKYNLFIILLVTLSFKFFLPRKVDFPCGKSFSIHEKNRKTECLRREFNILGFATPNTSSLKFNFQGFFVRGRGISALASARGCRKHASNF